MSSLRIFLFAVALLGLALGGVAPWLGFAERQELIWGLAAAVVLVSLMGEIFSSLSRGELGLDIVAGLSISAALLFGESLAAGVVASFAIGASRRGSHGCSGWSSATRPTR